jgi:hypothetical protein
VATFFRIVDALEEDSQGSHGLSLGSRCWAAYDDRLRLGANLLGNDLEEIPMGKVETLIRNIRRESQIAQVFGIVLFLVVGCGKLISLVQGKTTTNSNDMASVIGIMSMAFLCLAYSQLSTRLAQVAGAMSELQAAHGSARIDPRDTEIEPG